MKTGALIVASLNLDKGNRDNEDMAVFLPMQHLDGTTVVKREIFTLRKAGVTPIIVLCGYQQEVLKNHLSHNGVVFCEDEQFETHGFAETLEAGLAFAAGLCDRVLVVPVEYPAFSCGTVERLMECEGDAVPVYQEKEGYPRLHVFGETQELESTDRNRSFEGWGQPSVPEAVRGELLGDEDRIETNISSESGSGKSVGSESRGKVCRVGELLEVEDAGIVYSLTAPGGLERVREYTKERREANALQLKLKVMLTKEEDFFGPGVYWLLRNIDETGSIQAAAGRMQMSYSKCWKMINKAEAQMGFKFVDRVNGGKHGGRSTLTEEARVFLDRYHALTEDIRRMSRNFFDVYFREFQ